MPSTSPTTATVLQALTRDRLFVLGRIFGAGIRAANQPKAQVVALLGRALGDEQLAEIRRDLSRDEHEHESGIRGK